MSELMSLQRRRWGPLMPLVAFVICALAMGLVWQAVDTRLQRVQYNQFGADTHLITTRISERMASSVHMLRGAAGLFSATGNVTRAAWRRYVWELNLDQTPRGVQIMAYARRISALEREAYVAEVRREGYWDFELKPSGQRDEYASVHFLEPFSERTMRAFGYDMLSDPVRRLAMERARDSAEPIFSGRTPLLQHVDSSEDGGVLVFYPVYGSADVPQTVEGRRKQLTGWVYLTFRMNELMEALLSQQLQEIRLEIFDSDNAASESLLYDSLHSQGRPVRGVTLQQTTRLQIDGRIWTLRYSALPGYGSRLRADTAWVVLGAMVTICLLLFGMTWAFVNTRQRAHKIADRLTASLSSSEARYRSIFTHSGVTALLVDPAHSCIVEANEAAVRYYGIAAVDMRGMPLQALVSLDEAALESMLKEAVSERRSHVFQQHRLKSGLWREVEMHAGPIELDGRLLLYCVVHDITERHEAENAVLDLNQRYQALLDAASEVSIVASDREGLITVFNRGAERLLGYSASEMIGRMTPVAFHDGNEIQARGRALTAELAYPVSGFHTLVEVAVAQGSEQREWTYVRKDGTRCRVSLSVTPMRGIDGTITGYLGIALDISRLKEAEESLLQAKEAAEQASRAKSAFLATMSHEIRTPMNGVIGMAQLLQGTTLNNEQQEYAEIIISSAEALLIIINDILDFSKVEAGKLELELLPFEPHTLLAAVVGMFQPQTRARGIELRLEIDERLPRTLLGDAPRLRQILINLLGNAVKFTEQGSIEVSVRLVHIDAHEAGIRVAIRDTGVGMAAAVVDGLFAPFYQGDSSITRRFGGTGLGLSITHGLVELMGGSITVESTLGVGSVFTVHLSLPRALSRPSEEEKPDLVADSDTPLHGRVLVADDAVTNLKVAAQMLMRLGLKTALVKSGDEALRLLAREEFDLILMDCQMPVMDGFAATRLIRSGQAGESKRNIPIIAMTANALTGDREACLAAGMNDYLSKPVAFAVLRLKMLQWLTAGPAPQALPQAKQTPGLAASTSDTPTFDAAELSRNCGEDAALQAAVVEAALAAAPDEIERLQLVCTAADSAAVAHQCHVLVGLFAQISAQRLVTQLRLAEMQARQGAVPPAEWLAQVHHEYQLLLSAMGRAG